MKSSAKVKAVKLRKDDGTTLRGVVIDHNFTATGEAHMRQLAEAYGLYVKACSIVDEFQEGTEAERKAEKKRYRQAAKRGLGRDFETAKAVWEMMNA